MEVARAYQSCQTVQQQAITTLFATLANVDFSFENQTKKMLSQYKIRTLDEVVIALNPDANLVGDDNPQEQPPHIRSAYLLVLEEKGIEIDGREAAEMDVNKPYVDSHRADKVVKKFNELWDIDVFIQLFVNEINQKNGTSDYVDRDKFFKWVMAQPNDSKFEKHSIFYDEEKASDYDTAQAKDKIGFVPYLSFSVGTNILKFLKLISD